MFKWRFGNRISSSTTLPMDHGGDPTMPRCKMHMLWLVFLSVLYLPFLSFENRNSDIIDTCIVFRWWHVRSYPGFVLTIFIIALLGVLYEYLRVLQRNLDLHILSLSAKNRGVARDRDRSNSPRAGSAIGEGNLEAVGLLSGRLLLAKTTG